jgi:hypothetical protein
MHNINSVVIRRSRPKVMGMAFSGHGNRVTGLSGHNIAII